MLHTLKLLLPALIPSWNFFEAIAASPRIEYALLRSLDDESGADWLEFRPRPDHLSLLAMLGRLFWNVRWNEGLFVVSCAERLLDVPTAHSENEIFRRIAADLSDRPDQDGDVDGAWLRFRIALLSEHDHEGTIIKEIAFVSDARAIAAIAVR